MIRFVLSIFVVFIIFPCNLLAAQNTNCEIVDGVCPAGCNYEKASGGLFGEEKCSPCPAGTYNSKANSSCQECKKPNGAEYLDDGEGTYSGYTTDSCPWTLTCAEGEYFDSTNYGTTDSISGEIRLDGCVACNSYGDGNMIFVGIEDGGTCTASGEGRSAPKEDNGCNILAHCLYKINLTKNTNLSNLSVGGKNYDYSDKVVYYKYPEGFSYDDNAMAPFTQSLPENVLQPSNIIKEFTGYSVDETCREPYKLFDSEGIFIASYEDMTEEDKLYDFLKRSRSEMYACWNNNDVVITYRDESQTDKQICSILDKSEDPFLCVASEYQGDLAGFTVNEYYCYYIDEYGRERDCGFKVSVGKQIPIMSKQMILIPIKTLCNAGYYCSNGGEEPCPIGSTSTPGANEISDCYMMRGNRGTVFSDKNGYFYLPGSGRINYSPFN